MTSIGGGGGGAGGTFLKVILNFYEIISGSF